MIFGHPGYKEFILYKYGELEDSNITKFLSHIENCAVCSEKLAEITKLFETTNAIKTGKVKDEKFWKDYNADILNKVKTKEEGVSHKKLVFRNFFPVWQRWQFAAVVVVLLLVVNIGKEVFLPDTYVGDKDTIPVAQINDDEIIDLAVFEDDAESLDELFEDMDLDIFLTSSDIEDLDQYF